MCGIFAVINNSDTSYYKIEKFVQDALIVSQLRGMDSTGLFQVDRKYGTFLNKQAMCASNFLDLKHTKAYLNDSTTARVTLGHVRAATYGKVTTENAHPFEFEKPDKSGYICGVHNGSLTGWATKPDGKKFDVDSQWALSKIAAEGLDAFADIEGPYCFMWYDNSTENKNKFYAIRNSQRPMSFVLTKDKKQAFFMSEADMLALVVSRNEIGVETDIYNLEPEMLYTFDLSTDTVTWSKVHAPAKKNVYTSPAASNYIDNEYDNDWGDGMGWNYRAGMDPRLEYNEDTGAYDYTPTKQDDGKKDVLLNAEALKTISKWKTALNTAVAEVKDEELTTAGDLVLTNDDQPVRDTEKEYKAPASWFSKSTATHAEQETARATTMMGEIVFMEGIIYEPTTCEMFGTVQDFDYTTKDKVEYDAVARNLSAAAANREWQDKETNGGWGVVIGEYVDNATRKRTFVVAPLTDKGKKAFLKDKDTSIAA